MSQTPSYTKVLLPRTGRVLAWQRFARFRQAAREIGAAAGGERVQALLDLGAADGIAMPFLLPLAERVIGLNHSQGYSAQFAQAYPDQLVVTADGRALPFRDGSFDVVVCLETLYILPGPQARRECLEEIRRVLKRGGLFVCSVPIEVGLPALLKYIGRRFARIRSNRITFDLMLRHWLYGLFDITRYDQGIDHLGFNAYRFAEDVAGRFAILRGIRLPVCYPLCTTMMLVCRPR